jgi:hypothetical protein
VAVTRFNRAVALWCVVFSAACLPLIADDVPVPVEVQIALFQKIWKLDRTFQPGTPVELGVIYQEKYRPSVYVASQLLAAIRTAQLRIHCTLIDLDEEATVRQRIPSKGFDVFYVTPLRAIDVKTIADISRANGIRTITGVPDYVADGLAVGIGLLNGSPLIIVNLRGARAEGSDFSSHVLSLSRVIEDGGKAYAGPASQ